jgi:hypothetical protein
MNGRFRAGYSRRSDESSRRGQAPAPGAGERQRAVPAGGVAGAAGDPVAEAAARPDGAVPSRPRRARRKPFVL